MDMSSMDHSGMTGSNSTTGADSVACKISMLWNWHTIDACFLANTWHVRTKGQFAGSCIGVFFLVLALEFVRRAQREYDRSIVSQWQGPGDKETVQAKESGRGSANPPRRPTLLQHLVRCLFFTSQLCAAYIVMLIVMYYNGYMIICILLGAFLGRLLFAYDTLNSHEALQGGTTSCC